MNTKVNLNRDKVLYIMVCAAGEHWIVKLELNIHKRASISYK